MIEKNLRDTYWRKTELKYSVNFSGISGEVLRNFVGKNSKEFFRNFLKVSLETVIPQTSLILGTNSGEFLENFRGISYMK